MQSSCIVREGIRITYIPKCSAAYELIEENGSVGKFASRGRIICLLVRFRYPLPESSYLPSAK